MYLFSERNTACRKVETLGRERTSGGQFRGKKGDWVTVGNNEYGEKLGVTGWHRGIKPLPLSLLHAEG